MSETVDTAEAAARRLEASYARVAQTAMLGMPMVNPALAVKAVGMQHHGDEWLCVLITPWFMNLVLMPCAPSPETARVGTGSTALLPGGMIAFIQSDGQDVGPHRMCSLFSPVFEFESMEAAELTAQAVLGELMAASEADHDPDGMVAIWEGRLSDAENLATANKAAEAVRDEAETAAPRISRRALFGGSGRSALPEANT